MRSVRTCHRCRQLQGVEGHLGVDGLAVIRRLCHLVRRVRPVILPDVFQSVVEAAELRIASQLCDLGGAGALLVVVDLDLQPRLPFERGLVSAGQRVHGTVERGLIPAHQLAFCSGCQCTHAQHWDIVTDKLSTGGPGRLSRVEPQRVDGQGDARAFWSTLGCHRGSALCGGPVAVCLYTASLCAAGPSLPGAPRAQCPHAAAVFALVSCSP